MGDYIGLKEPSVNNKKSLLLQFELVKLDKTLGKMRKHISIKHVTDFAAYLYILYCLSPFVRYKTAIPQTGYIMASCIFMSILFISGTIKISKQKNVHISKVDICMSLWTICAVASFFVMQHTSGTADFITLGAYFSPIIFYFIFRLVNCVSNVRRLTAITVMAVLLQILFCICRQTDAFQASMQPSATFFNSGLFGGFISVGIIAATALPVYTKFAGYSRIIIFCVLTAILIIFVYWLLLTESRAALIALFVSLPVLLYKKAAQKISFIPSVMKKYKWYLMTAGIILFVAAVCYLYGIRPDSANGRLFVWQTSVKMIREKPLSGHGLDGFRKNYMFYQAEFMERCPDSPFAQLAADTAMPLNEFIKIGVEQGITGMLVVLFLLMIVFSAKGNAETGISLHIAKTFLTAILVFGLFSYPTESFRFRLVISVFLASVAGMTSGGKTLKFGSGKYIVIFAFAGAVATGYLWISSCRFLAAANSFDRIFHSSSRRAEQLEVLYPQLNSTFEYLSLYGQLLKEENRPEQALPVILRMETVFPSPSLQMEKGEIYSSLGMIRQSDSAWLLASRMSPKLFRPHYMLAKSYYEQGDYEKACRHARIVLERRPQHYTPEIYYMRKEVEKMRICEKISGE
jgi:O-antigen ligase